MSFVLYAKKNELYVRDREPVTSGSKNVYDVRFEFSEEWAGLTRTAVFRSGGEPVSVLLEEPSQCTVPWETLQEPRARLTAGVYGTKNGDTVLPTVWADLGEILPGVKPGKDAQEPAPDLLQQKLDKKQDKLNGLPGQIVGFDKDGNAVPQDPPKYGDGSSVEMPRIATDEEVTEMLNEVFSSPNIDS